MKLTYVIAGLLALYYWRHHNGTASDGTTRTQEAHGEDGSNPLTDMWGLLNGQGTSSANFSNLVPGPNANPGGHAAQLLALNPAWDGSLA